MYYAEINAKRNFTQKNSADTGNSTYMNKCVIVLRSYLCSIFSLLICWHLKNSLASIPPSSARMIRTNKYKTICKNKVQNSILVSHNLADSEKLIGDGVNKLFVLTFRVWGHAVLSRAVVYLMIILWNLNCSHCYLELTNMT